MSNENKSIHEFEMQLICEYFSVLERQGPGSSEVTRKALSFIDNLHAKSRIADLGCGTGAEGMGSILETWRICCGYRGVLVYTGASGRD